MNVSEVMTLLASVLEITVTVAGFVIAYKEYMKNKRSKMKKLFIEQITAYYYEEQEAIKWIQQLSNEQIPNLQQKLRKKAQKNEENTDNIYPKMTPKEAESYK